MMKHRNQVEIPGRQKWSVALMCESNRLNGLRTISMRIRGFNEETEELDDDLVNIKNDISEFTNGKVSIMEDAD